MTEDITKSIAYLAHKDKSNDISMDKIIKAAKTLLGELPSKHRLTLALIRLEKISVVKLAEYEKTYEQYTRNNK